MLLLTLFFRLLLLVYQVTTLSDFYPSDNVRNDTLRLRVTECVVNGLFMAIPPAGRLFTLSWAGNAAPWIYAGLSAGAWSRYQKSFFQPAPAQQREYDHISRSTIQVVPDRGGRPRPNLEHVILPVILVLTTARTFAIR